MQNDTFKFFLYRLNKEYRNDLFTDHNLPKRPDDEWLQEYFSSICNREYDFRKETPRASYIWSLLNYQNLNESFSSVVLARSQVQKTGTFVAGNVLNVGYSISTPPPADSIILLILWKRHIVVVENRAGMTTGETWLRNLHAIIDNAKTKIRIPIAPRLEPIPIKGTILDHLKNLDRIFRFRVRLKLPNPELSRWAKRIYDEMVEEKLTEYLQEFYSPTGIKVDDTSKAFSSGALAELGYKDGGVQIQGEKDGKPILIDEGKTAIKGRIDQGRVDELRAYLRGLGVNATGKQFNKALSNIENEVNRLFPHED